MAFELTVSAQRDPLESGELGEREVPCKALAKIVVNGTCDEAASQAILTTVADLARDEAHSIIVEMHDVDASDAVGLRSLAVGLMEQRSSGIHVQIAARHEKLHARMAALPDSRDWLLGFKDADVASARRAIHVDGILNQAG
jgi:anti-anti-sigma regulatory factor